MEQFTAYFLSLLEVLEKEIALFKQSTARAFGGLCFLAVGVFLLGAGFLLLAWTCFTALSLAIGAVWAGLAVTVLLVLGGGLFLWISKKNLK